MNRKLSPETDGGMEASKLEESLCQFTHELFYNKFNIIKLSNIVLKHNSGNLYYKYIIA